MKNMLLLGDGGDMAKFNYRMQNILDIKYKLEDQAKSEFSLAMNKLREEEAVLEQIYGSINYYEELIRAEGTGAVNVIELMRCTGAIEIKKEQAQIQKKKIKAAELNVEKARDRLNEVMIDRKTHEILKEKAFEQFKQDLLAQESKEIDELVSFKGNNGGKH